MRLRAADAALGAVEPAQRRDGPCGRGGPTALNLLTKQPPLMPLAEMPRELELLHSGGCMRRQRSRIAWYISGGSGTQMAAA